MKAIIDNAVDEAMGGHNEVVDVTIHPDGSRPAALSLPAKI